MIAVYKNELYEYVCGAYVVENEVNLLCNVFKKTGVRFCYGGDGVAAGAAGDARVTFAIS